ncbi:MAG: dTDP-4-dehydrorhamnose reductase family protein [Terriglobales bacterium]
MRVLILGAAGMLGHKLWQTLRGRFDTWATLRSPLRSYPQYELFDSQRTVDGVDAREFSSVQRAVETARPAVVINCIGIIKQLPEAQDPILSLTVNSQFPHRLQQLCRQTDARLLHFSTDCVFSGRKGNYTEDDVSDAEDLYGRTKFLGELDSPGSLTLRTSMIGRELRTRSGLVEWLLHNRRGKIRGFTRAIFSGLTTLALARIVADVIERHPQLSGLYNLSSDPISKHDLLLLLREAYGLQVEIEPSPEPASDRSLNSRRFREATGFVPQPWLQMVAEMAHEPSPYESWRSIPAC